MALNRHHLVSMPFWPLLILFLMLPLGACGDNPVSISPGVKAQSSPSDTAAADSSSQAQTSDGGSSPNNIQSTPVGVQAVSGSSQISLQGIFSQGDQNAGWLPVWANADLNAPIYNVSRAIIIFHDAARDANYTIRTALSAVGKAGGNISVSNTLIVCPWFAADANNVPDSFSFRPVMAWSSDSYMVGFRATSGASISSFAPVDQLLRRLNDNSVFPYLQHVYVIGHSGGGQSTHRFAIGSKAVADWNYTFSTLTFAIANPSSYTYFDKNRPGSDGNFAIFDGNTCGGFNTYRYGLTGLPDYYAGVSASGLPAKYLSRDVHYLYGTADTDPNSIGLDKSCPAAAQGNVRYVRGHNYWNYIHQLNIPVAHSICDVPGIAHDTFGMINSNCMLQILRQ